MDGHLLPGVTSPHRLCKTKRYPFGRLFLLYVNYATTDITDTSAQKLAAACSFHTMGYSQCSLLPPLKLNTAQLHNRDLHPAHCCHRHTPQSCRHNPAHHHIHSGSKASSFVATDLVHQILDKGFHINFNPEMVVKSLQQVT